VTVPQGDSSRKKQFQKKNKGGEKRGDGVCWVTHRYTTVRIEEVQPKGT